jgi:Tfp pilus assembly protein PilF
LDEVTEAHAQLPSPSTMTTQTLPRWLWPAALTLLVLACFASVLGAEFLEWDDPHNLSQNADFNPPSRHGLARYWKAPFEGLYVPVTYTVWMGAAWASQMIHGRSRLLDPHLFHAVNLLAHAICVALVWLILRRLLDEASGADVAAAIGAALFAAHPLQVETVAWVSGLKDLLGALFGLVAIYQYLRFAQASRSPPTSRSWKRRRSHYVLATAAYITALLCKPSCVAVPVIAGILAVGVGRYVRIRTAAASLAPWLILAVPIVLVTRIAQPALLTRPLAPVWRRPQIAADALAFYLGKLAYPARLAIDYGRSPDIVAHDPAARLTWLVPVGLALLLWLLRRQTRIVGFAALVFFTAMLPMLGLIPFDFQFYSTVADHYAYLAMLGPALALAWLVGTSRPRTLLKALAAAVIVILGAMSFRQARVWHDTASAFDHTLRVNPNSWLSHINLSYYAILHEDSKSAVAHARAALALRPEDGMIHVNLGYGLGVQGDVNGAMEQFRIAIQMMPQEPVPHAALADTLVAAGQLNDAVAEYHEALRLNPHLHRAHAGLARVEAMRAPSTSTRPTQRRG